LPSFSRALRPSHTTDGDHKRLPTGAIGRADSQAPFHDFPVWYANERQPGGDDGESRSRRLRCFSRHLPLQQLRQADRRRFDQAPAALPVLWQRRVRNRQRRRQRQRPLPRRLAKAPRRSSDRSPLGAECAAAEHAASS